MSVILTNYLCRAKKRFIYFSIILAVHQFYSSDVLQEHNPYAALTFYWEPLHRSVRIEGKARRVASEESDTYFASRPRPSQIGAWVSAQSSVIRGREELVEAELRLTENYRDQPVPRPPHWGGYVLEPETMEFWQGQSDRIHDRIRFRRPRPGEASHAAADWLLERLAP